MIDWSPPTMKYAAKEAVVQLCSPETDMFLEDLTETPIGFSASMSSGSRAKDHLESLTRAQKSQRTLGAWT